MTNHIFSDVIRQMTAATDRELGVIDAEGTVIACSNSEQLGVKLPKLSRVVSLSEDQVIHFSGKTVKALNRAYFAGDLREIQALDPDGSIAGLWDRGGDLTALYVRSVLEELGQTHTFWDYAMKG